MESNESMGVVDMRGKLRSIEEETMPSANIRRSIGSLEIPPYRGSLSIPSFPSPPSHRPAHWQGRRTSAFKEIGLDDDDGKSRATLAFPAVSASMKNFASRDETIENVSAENSEKEEEEEEEEEEPLTWSIGHEKSAGFIANSSTPPAAFPRLNRLVFFALALVLVLPAFHSTPILGKTGYNGFGVKGGLIRKSKAETRWEQDARIASRDNSPTDVCTRWAHQSAVVNGTLYVYGGQATTQAGQTDNTWNNDLLSLDLTKTWQISTPTLNGLPQPSGPPAVSLGYLWNSYDSLYLYGGEYSWKPVESPSPFALWEYDIASSSWIEHNDPQTSAGNNSEAANQPVQQVAEGAGISIPELGRGYYFGGHQDGYTTAGWSQSTNRIYIKSLLEYTFPGQTNSGVQGLSGGAGKDGVWRNITLGGLQAEAGFTERADGVLVYVPGWGTQGIILGLAGGTNATFTQMNVIDVYDIGNSTWYKQATSGSYPEMRVNPCAVAASAEDGTSTNIYMFGGQNLIPAGNQTLYNDMWILTIPSFTWIQVDTNSQSVPPARSGHTCDAWDGQMVVVGGYVGTDTLSCDSPGIYVFDMSELKWDNQFTALNGGNDQNQQISQESKGSGGSENSDSAGLSGSYGYQVPGAVQSVIGGQGSGGATVTAPVQSATDGPLATGKPITYTVSGAPTVVTTTINGKPTVVTQSGSLVTETASSSTSGGNNGNGGGSSSNKGKSGPNIGAIVAGVIAGCFAILAAYLGFCAWVYRRQLALYKNHVAMSQRVAAGPPGAEKLGAAIFPYSSRGSSDPAKYSTDESSGQGRSAAGASSGSGYASIPVYPPVGGNSTANSSTEDLMAGQEPSFLGVMLSPRKSLRVINRD
ncbi:MAG: hypothetical protein M1827_004243 [Pycnora praestabilis]|nr:MAG: hypothetical protein M1827_004243 [Pycnora praestabilis]